MFIKEEKFIYRLVILAISIVGIAHYSHSLENKVPFIGQSGYDLTVIGRVQFADGIGRHAIEIMDTIADSLKVNFLSMCGNFGCIDFKDVPGSIQAIIQTPFNYCGSVSLYVDSLGFSIARFMQKVASSKIKIAYSVFEATRIPMRWVFTLNKNFDAVVVPDAFLEEVYRNCGVEIPIFVLPLPIYIDKFLEKPLKAMPDKPFTFGMSAQFLQRKNHMLLLEAFVQEFGNNPAVRLYLHGRNGDNKIVQDLHNKIKKSGCKNAFIVQKSLGADGYIDFLSSLDCYVFVSSGEGFSITPREALACGIPCILSDNSAHRTICKTSYLASVPALVPQRIRFSKKYKDNYGYLFSPTVKDVRKALRDVYNNYGYWLEKAYQGREWVKQYQPENLKAKYVSLIKPKQVLLGDRNIVESDYIMTSSRQLYQKYKSLLENFKKRV